MSSSYKELEIYKTAFSMAVRIYHLSLNLPMPDKFETGSQIRKSSQSIKDNIVEGYGRKHFKADFRKFLIASHASCLEAISQAEFLSEVRQDEQWKEIASELEKLSLKIHNFIAYVEKNWKT